MRILSLQCKWLLAILTWIISKPVQQSNQNYINDTSNEYSNRDTEVGQSAHAVLCKDKQMGLQSRWIYKASILCVPQHRTIESLPAPHTALQSCSKRTNTTNVTCHRKREVHKALSKPWQWQAVVCTSVPHDYQKLWAPKGKVVNPNRWCLSDKRKISRYPQVWQPG